MQMVRIMKQKYNFSSIRSTSKEGLNAEILLFIANELAVLNGWKSEVKTAKLTKKEDAFWEEVYNQLVVWAIHEDFTHDLCFSIVKARFRRLKDVKKLI